MTSLATGVDGGELKTEKNVQIDESARRTEELVPLSASTAPDGGTRAWLQVLGGFFVLFNSWWVKYPLLPPTDN